MSKNSKNVKVAHPGLLFESGGLGWFEMTYLSSVRLVFFSRPLPSSMAPMPKIWFLCSLRKDARLMDQKHSKKC